MIPGLGRRELEAAARSSFGHGFSLCRDRGHGARTELTTWKGRRWEMRVLRNAGRVQDRRAARGSGQLQELLQGVLLHSFHEELIVLWEKPQGCSAGQACRLPPGGQHKVLHSTGESDAEHNRAGWAQPPQNRLQPSQATVLQRAFP